MKFEMPNLLRLPPGKPAKRPAKMKLKASMARSSDMDDDEECEEPGSEMKLSHAFVVVLVLHVIAVGGVFAFNAIKARQAADAPFKSAASEPPAKAEPPVESAASGAQEARPLTAAPAATTSQPSHGSATRTHEVRPGDTLTRIANLYGVSIAAVEKENDITDPGALRVGDNLKIPGRDSASKPLPPSKNAAAAQGARQPARAAAVSASKTGAPPKAADTTQPRPSADTYVVMKGDNPLSIARKLKVSYGDLLKANNITDPKKLQIGQKLKVPSKKS